MANGKWDDSFYLRTYELAKLGLTDQEIATSLGVSAYCFTKWKQFRPALRDAVQKGRRSRPGPNEESLEQYVYNRLPHHLKELWERINACHKLNNGVLRAEAMLEEAGLRARQHLFLYALTRSGFNPSEACKRLNVRKSTLDSWVRLDPDFADLLREMHWHKGNFFESALIRKVAEGDPACIVFANRTFNRDRGYSEKVSVEGKHLHAHVTPDPTAPDRTVPVSALNLSLDVRRAIVEAYRRNNLLDLGELEDTPRERSIRTCDAPGDGGTPVEGLHPSLPPGRPVAEPPVQDPLPAEEGTEPVDRPGGGHPPGTPGTQPPAPG